MQPINLDSHIDRKMNALVGRSLGQRILKTLENEYALSKHEAEAEPITIVIPERIITINKSWFLGMFETKIANLGSRGFRDHYIFNTSNYINKKIDKYIDSALLDVSQEEILGV